MPSFSDLIAILLDDGRLYRALRAVHQRWQRVVEFDDFAQEVMLRCWVKRATFRGDDAERFLAWIRVVARSVLVDWFRHEKALSRGGGTRTTQPLDSRLGAPASENPAAKAMVQEEIARALAALEPEERLVVANHYLGGYTFREIADLLQRPYHAITRLHVRALRRLRQLEEN